MKKRGYYGDSAKSVLSAKGWFIVLGILSLIGGVILLMGGSDEWFSAFAMTIIMWTIGGILNGLAEITEAAERYNESHPIKEDDDK